MLPCAHLESSLRARFPARDYITGDAFQIADCADCGCTITSPQPADLTRYYPGSYYGQAGRRRFPAAVEALQNALYRRRVRLVERFARRSRGRVLDVGCGRGLLLKAFRDRGWKVQGTEFSETAARYPREVLGLDVATGDLLDLRLPDASFDAVTLWHVLEHVRDPRVILEEIRRLLKPGGVLFLGVPNFGGWEARICRDKWFHLDVPRHLNHLTRERLESLLHANGFHVRRTFGFSAEYDLFSFVQSFLSRLGLRHNLLYNLLRQGPAKVLNVGDVPLWQIPAALVLGPLLAVLGWPWLVAAGLLREGGTLTMVALRK